MASFFSGEGACMGLIDGRVYIAHVSKFGYRPLIRGNDTVEVPMASVVLIRTDIVGEKLPGNVAGDFTVIQTNRPLELKEGAVRVDSVKNGLAAFTVTDSSTGASRKVTARIGACVVFFQEVMVNPFNTEQPRGKKVVAQISSGGEFTDGKWTNAYVEMDAYRVWPE
jgi:hypothetical protein